MVECQGGSILLEGRSFPTLLLGEGAVEVMCVCLWVADPGGLFLFLYTGGGLSSRRALIHSRKRNPFTPDRIWGAAGRQKGTRRRRQAKSSQNPHRN